MSAPGQRGAHRARRPSADEHARFYDGYLAVVRDGDVVETLEAQGVELQGLFDGVPADRETFAYAPGKWSVREVAGHVVDGERVFQYRMAHIARGDPAPLPDMDQEVWAAGSDAADRPLSELAREMAAVRASTLALLRGLPPEAWERRGVASGREVTVRALAWIAAGHAGHHLNVLRERYGVGAR